MPESTGRSSTRQTDVIVEKVSLQQKWRMNAKGDPEMLICVGPLSEVRASGIVGVTDPSRANELTGSGMLEPGRAAGRGLFTFAGETIDGAGARYRTLFTKATLTISAR
ncbi:MAG: hypothetical protein IPJ30_16160 [Acidobacteria bacterium]|nr:hypothetical protein [Acidobacteriota bacterium]